MPIGVVGTPRQWGVKTAGAATGTDCRISCDIRPVSTKTSGISQHPQHAEHYYGSHPCHFLGCARSAHRVPFQKRAERSRHSNRNDKHGGARDYRWSALCVGADLGLRGSHIGQSSPWLGQNTGCGSGDCSGGRCRSGRVRSSKTHLAPAWCITATASPDIRWRGVDGCRHSAYPWRQ